jgi:hypothetical protein
MGRATIVRPLFYIYIFDGVLIGWLGGSREGPGQPPADEFGAEAYECDA